MTRTAIIFIESDFTLKASGYLNRCYDQVAFLSQRYEVVVYSFRGHNEHPWDNDAAQRFKQSFPNARLVLDDRTKTLERLNKIKNAMLALAPGLAKQVLSFSLKNATPNYRLLLQQLDDFVFVVNTVDAMTALNGLPLRNVVVDTHDVKFVKFARKAGLSIFDAKVLARFRGEFGALAEVSALVTVSPVETAIFKLFLPDQKVFYVPDLADLADRLSFDTDGMANEPQYDLVFVGSSYHFNVVGCLEFLTKNRSWLEARRIAIAGRVCENDKIIALAQGWSNLQLLGFVPDLRHLYARTKAALSPISGTGLKVKIIEALANSVPVFASEQSFEGLPLGYEGCVFPCERGVMEATLDNPTAIAAAAAAARAYYQQFHGAGERDALTLFLSASSMFASGEAAQPEVGR